jgi:ElaB/YqjD/DUF883 family membrane-anchored ribosome-binding protein
MTQAYRAARSRFVRSANDAQDKVMSLEADFEDRVTQNPLAALAIAVGIGLVVGMISQPHR